MRPAVRRAMRKLDRSVQRGDGVTPRIQRSIRNHHALHLLMVLVLMAKQSLGHQELTIVFIAGWCRQGISKI